MSKRDPLSQLASFRIEADEDTRARDLEAIRTELRRRPPGPTAARRRWTLGVVVAIMVAGPTAAIAADDALPGDILYPIKRAAEPIVELFDRDVVIEHRVEEVAGLVDRGTDEVMIKESIDVARDALAQTDAPLLERELDRIIDRWITDRAPATDRPTDQPTTTEPTSNTPSGQRDREPEPAPADVPDSSTATSDRTEASEPPPSDTTTTTTVHRDTDDRPPSDDRLRDAP